MKTILQGVFDLTQAAQPPSVWPFLDPDSNLRQLPEAESLKRSLTKSLPEEQLARAGILIPGDNGEKRLSPVLAGGTRQALFLRSEVGEIIDVVNMYGALASNDPPAYSSCLDHSSVIWCGDSKGILVAFGEDDLAVLRMLELACTPAAGMEKISGQQARRLLAAPQDLEVERYLQEDMAPVAVGKFRLVLVGWRPATLALECPEALPAVGSRLLNAETLLGLDCSPMASVWFPTGGELARIRAALEFREAPLVREQMWRSIDRSSYSIREFYKVTSPKSPTGYALARSELRALLRPGRPTTASPDSVKAKLSEFESEFQRCVVDTAIQDAMSTTDPLEQGLKLMAAELMNQLQHRDRLKLWAKEYGEGRYRPPDESYPPDEFDQNLRLIDRFVKIQQALLKTKQPSTGLTTRAAK